MDNPFAGITKRRRERKVFQPGIYQGTLREVKSVQVEDKKTNEKVTKLVFVYYIESEDAEIPAFFKPSLADASHIVKFLKASFGDKFTSEIQSSEEKIWAFIKGTIGQDYNLVVTLSNGWNNISNAMPLKSKVSPTTEVPGDIKFSDDDIPF
jgi:hypothetical protein